MILIEFIPCPTVVNIPRQTNQNVLSKEGFLGFSRPISLPSMANMLLENRGIDELIEGEEYEDLEDWGDWRASEEDEVESDDCASDIHCLFCDLKYSSCTALFEHCSSRHGFDFHAVQKTLSLDFYGSMKLINYVRSQVAENQCWSCGLSCQSSQDLQNHSHEVICYDYIGPVLDDDEYLKPFMQDDPLLYSFGDDGEAEDVDTASADREEIMRELGSFEVPCGDNDEFEDIFTSDSADYSENGRPANVPTSNSILSGKNLSKVSAINEIDAKEPLGTYGRRLKGKHHIPFPNTVARDIENVDKSYFSSYSSFGIHREMIDDKVRMGAYRNTILNNPSLLNGAVVMDVGCGTGILSLFAAQAGASSVIAVEASDKMAMVASQVARDNGLLQGNKMDNQHHGVIKVVQGMVEELRNSVEIQPQSVDVLLSEWMGYCLLYESMLSSVLLARDRWLKPGGAILPDRATIFAAGFGRGGTSIPFWENVYGFNMSCIGMEVDEAAACVPVVDIIESVDIMTNTAALKSFDLVEMKLDEMDFTATVQLEPKPGPMTWCHGVVLWFDAGFTARFCREAPVVLSTSPYAPRTHWSQTILTLRNPVALALVAEIVVADRMASVGTGKNPAVRIDTRISIARAVEHRSIDISLEIVAVGGDGGKRRWSPQLFHLS